jgi:hypothetical protein
MYIPYKLQILKRSFFRRTQGEKRLRHTYQQLFGKVLDTENATTFSEKMFTRMVAINRNGNKEYTRLADKYLAREFVKERIGQEHLIDLLWTGTRPEDIPFDSLPEKCIIKTNHGSGGNIVVNGKVDRHDTIRTVKRWLKQNYYWIADEYHYDAIPRRLLVEQLLNDGESNGPLDYRFWCFGGKPAIIQVDNHLHDINPFFDVDWNLLELSYRRKFRPCTIRQPQNFDKMLEVASRLAAGFDFVRVDLYNVNGKIYFGEMTFTPVGGRFVFNPPSWDDKLGALWNFTNEVKAGKSPAARPQPVFAADMVDPTDASPVLNP